MSEFNATAVRRICRRQPRYGLNQIPPIARSTVAIPNDSQTSTPVDRYAQTATVPRWLGQRVKFDPKPSNRDPFQTFSRCC